jgi:hypothetical protein
MYLLLPAFALLRTYQSRRYPLSIALDPQSEPFPQSERDHALTTADVNSEHLITFAITYCVSDLAKVATLQVTQIGVFATREPLLF